MGDNQRTRFRQQPFQVPKIGTVKSISLDLIVSLLIATYSTWGRLTAPSWSGRTLSSLAVAWCITRKGDCSEPSPYITTRQLATSISPHQSTSQAQPAPQVLLDTHVKMNFVLKMQHPEFHFHMISNQIFVFEAKPSN